MGVAAGVWVLLFGTIFGWSSSGFGGLSWAFLFLSEGAWFTFSLVNSVADRELGLSIVKLVRCLVRVTTGIRIFLGWLVST